MPQKRTSKRKSARKRPAPAKPDHTLEKGVDNFADELGSLGERFGKRCEKKGKEMEGWFHGTFGVVGPLISSVIGLIILGIFLWILSLVNIPLGIGLLHNIHYFLMAHIGWFFIIFLFFSYTTYVSKVFPKGYRPFSPIASSIGIVIALWIVAGAIRVVNISIGSNLLTSFALFLESSMVVFFYLFILLGYLVLIVSSATKRAFKQDAPAVKEEKPVKAVKTGRLYRSGNERILGGVCGGIAEYLGVDPVMIRLLWIVFSLVWGAGVILYIIMWIIMPRNPKHKWEK